MKTRKVREVREERIGKKSKKLVGFLTVIVAGYFVFFTSKIWIPDSGTLKSATHYYQKLVYETYDIYLIHSETENNIIKYNFSQHYLESLNSNKVMFANTLDNKKIEANEEIVLFTVLGKKDNPIDPPNPENFTKENCDYGIEVTITFHDTKQAPRSE